MYREEEWRKVFIHETFHYFEFDNLSESVKTLFPVAPFVDLKETYCEVWARIINCALSGQTEKCIARERQWSCFQMVKVLDYMGLRYADLLEKRNLERYQEKTNVFAYIVLGAILMQDPRRFMLWSNGFNAPQGLSTLIESLHRTPPFLKLVEKTERLYAKEKQAGTVKSVTMRMSCVV